MELKLTEPAKEALQKLFQTREISPIRIRRFVIGGG